MDKPDFITYKLALLSCCRFAAGYGAQVAQLVEQGTENPRVGGSIPSLGTICSSESFQEPPKNALEAL